MIEIPKSDTCHQASDLRYHYRLNFSTEIMRDFQIRDVMNRRKTSRLLIKVLVQRNEYVSFSIVNKGSVPVRNWTVQIIVSYEGLELDRQYIIDPTIQYKQILAQGSYEEIKSPDIAKIESRKCHLFIISRLRTDNAEMILPRTAIEVLKIKANYINPEFFALYWQIDADDGKRTYGFSSQASSESHEITETGFDGDNLLEGL